MQICRCRSNEMDSMDHKDKKPIKFVKRQYHEHPYCTNWPITEYGEQTGSVDRQTKLEINSVCPRYPIGWIETELSKSVMERLQSYIEEAKKNPIKANDYLAGNISNSLELEDKDNLFF